MALYVFKYATRAAIFRSKTASHISFFQTLETFDVGRSTFDLSRRIEKKADVGRSLRLALAPSTQNPVPSF